MSRPVAFTDANVIYAAAARDLLVELAITKAITLPVVAAAARIRARLVNPSVAPGDYLLGLARGALPLTAQALRSFEDQL